MAWYYQGSVTIAPGSNVVTGTGTQWLANLYGIGEGQALVIGAERLEIMYVDSDTSLRLALPHTAGYSGSYHIETSYAGTGGDASRQIMACIRRFSTLVVDWTEWMTSTADTMTATDPFGNPVEIATYHAFSKGVGFKDELALQGYTVKDSEGNDVVINPLKDTQGGLKNITDRVQSYDLNNGITWKATTKILGGLQIGSSEYSGFDLLQHTGRYIRIENTPHGAANFMRIFKREANGDNISAFDIPAGIGIAATRQWVNQYVGTTIGGGSQLQTTGATTTIAVNPNGNAGMWESSTNRWLLRANPTVSDMDVTKNIYLINQDPESASSKVEISAPDGNTKVGLWAYNDKRVLLSGYKNGSWANIDVYNLATAIDFQANDTGVSLQSQGARAWYTNKDGNAGIWNKNRLSSDLMVNSDGFNIYMPVVSNPPNKYGSFTINGYSEKFMWEANGGAGGGCYFVRRNSANTNLGYLTLPIIHGGGTVVTSADAGLHSVYVDGSGYVKKASPIVMIKHNCYSTNAESRGAKVTKLSTGEYLVTNILGYNGDGAWGINGGISVPKDVNGLELVYVKDEIQSDGSIVVNTYHRQHSHLPEMFQNNRKKKDGSFYADGEPCDLPTYSRLDLRVQMPENCEYNRKTYAIERHNQLFKIYKAQQDVLSNKTLALPLL